MTLDADPHIARVADRARLVDAHADPVERELRQQQQRELMREGLDQLELRSRQPRQHSLGDALVVDGVLDTVAAGRARAIAGQLQIDQQRLRRAPLPIDEADDALRAQTPQKNAIAVIAVAVNAIVADRKST